MYLRSIRLRLFALPEVFLTIIYNLASANLFIIFCEYNKFQPFHTTTGEKAKGTDNWINLMEQNQRLLVRKYIEAETIHQFLTTLLIYKVRDKKQRLILIKCNVLL